MSRKPIRFESRGEAVFTALVAGVVFIPVYALAGVFLVRATGWPVWPVVALLVVPPLVVDVVRNLLRVVPAGGSGSCTVDEDGYCECGMTWPVDPPPSDNAAPDGGSRTVDNEGRA